MKKSSNLKELMGYAGGHRVLTYLSLLLSAVSAVLALFPFVFLFRIIHEAIAVVPDYAQATHMIHNGWMAVGSALLSMVVYFAVLMCSHLSAFRIAGEYSQGADGPHRPASAGLHRGDGQRENPPHRQRLQRGR